MMLLPLDMLLSTEGMSLYEIFKPITDANFRTTGGSGGTQTTVTTLAALTSAVSGDAKKIVIISGMLIPSGGFSVLAQIFIGTITGSAVVKVGSNTSVIGKSGSGMCCYNVILVNEY